MKVWVFIALCGLVGCKVLKTRETVDRELKKDMKMNTMVLKAAVRETNRITYWPDGNVYQLERVMEQVDEARLAEMKLEGKQTTKHQEMLKEREPVKWLQHAGVMVIALLLICMAVWVYWKIIR